MHVILPLYLICSKRGCFINQNFKECWKPAKTKVCSISFYVCFHRHFEWTVISISKRCYTDIVKPSFLFAEMLSKKCFTLELKSFIIKTVNIFRAKVLHIHEHLLVVLNTDCCEPVFYLFYCFCLKWTGNVGLVPPPPPPKKSILSQVNCKQVVMNKSWFTLHYDLITRKIRGCSIIFYSTVKPTIIF